MVGIRRIRIGRLCAVIATNDKNRLLRPSAARGAEQPPVKIDRRLDSSIEPGDLQGDRSAERMADRRRPAQVKPAPRIVTIERLQRIEDLCRAGSDADDFRISDLHGPREGGDGGEIHLASARRGYRAVGPCAVGRVIPHHRYDEAAAGEVTRHCSVRDRPAVPCRKIQQDGSA
jgi:hypothetical protein